MKLIRVTDKCHVNPTDISEVEMSEYGYITIKMRSGAGHSFEPNYRESNFAAFDRIIREINEALKVGTKNDRI